MMRNLLFAVMCVCSISYTLQATTHSNSLVKQVVKNRYITLYIPKITELQKEDLQKELLSYHGKVVEVIYNENTRQLTVYYTPELHYEDIVQVVFKYTQDVTKISGTEL